MVQRAMARTQGIPCSALFSTSSGPRQSSAANEPTELRSPGKLPEAVYQTTIEHPAGVAYGTAADPDAKFAVVRISGKQYKVGVDDVVVTDSLRKKVDVGDAIELDDVLLVGSKGKTVVGQPIVSEAVVRASVEEHT